MKEKQKVSVRQWTSRLLFFLPSTLSFFSCDCVFHLGTFINWVGALWIPFSNGNLIFIVHLFREDAYPLEDVLHRSSSREEPAQRAELLPTCVSNVASDKDSGATFPQLPQTDRCLVKDFVA